MYKNRIAIFVKIAILIWSEKRDSNPQHSAWEADALPLNYSRITGLIISQFSLRCKSKNEFRKNNCDIYQSFLFFYSREAAALSSSRTASGWFCRTEAGQAGVTSPLIVCAIALAFFSPVAMRTIFFAFMMEPMPMVSA